MRTIHLLSLLFCLTIGATMDTLSQTPSGTSLGTELQQILDAQAAAWNRGDGQAWAAAFSEDADFINIRGDVFHGRDAIGQQHARIFAGPFKGSHATITVRRVTEPAAGVELIDTDHEVSGFAFLPPGIAPSTPGILRTHMKYVAVKKNGRWELVAAQNTAVAPAASMPK